MDDGARCVSGGSGVKCICQRGLGGECSGGTFEEKCLSRRVGGLGEVGGALGGCPLGGIARTTEELAPMTTVV